MAGTLIAVCLKSYYGEATSLDVEPNPMFIVVKVDGNKTSVVDCGYQSLEELKKSWPEATTQEAEA